MVQKYQMGNKKVFGKARSSRRENMTKTNPRSSVIKSNLKGMLARTVTSNNADYTQILFENM